MRIEPLPLTFRKHEMSDVMACLNAGDSCAIVGIGSVGKSNLLRFLQRPDVQRHYLDENLSFATVFIDVNKMLSSSAWGLWELMLHELLTEMVNRDIDAATAEQLDNLYRQATEPCGRPLALRHLDRAVRLVCGRLGYRLVFLIDEFDELNHSLPPRAFSALRALRDDNKYHLMFVTAMRANPFRLRTSGTTEAFDELIAPNIVWVGPYSDPDLQVIVERLGKRHDMELDRAAVDHLGLITGGHPGLVRIMFGLLAADPNISLTTLSTHVEVQDECRRIWASLEADEHRALTALAMNVPDTFLNTNTMLSLQSKGLVGGAYVEPGIIFSAAFREWIACNRPTVGAQIYVDRERRVVWVDGRSIANLAPLEYKLIAYLAEHPGRVCSRDELAEHLYPLDASATGAGVSDARIDTLVRRLRKRIEPVPDEPRYILNMRGHGFSLDQAGGVS